MKKPEDIKVRGKLVFVRNDFNVPIDKSGRILDDSRITASLQTIEYLLKKGAKVVCSSHLGRPGGRYKKELTLAPVAERMGALIGTDVIFFGETFGSRVEKTKREMKNGSILLLENLRFYKEEKNNDERFASYLSENIDVYINDAFGASHRSHASIVSVPKLVPTAIPGKLLSKEIEILNRALVNPPPKYTVILGGAKVNDKIPVILNLMDKAENFLIGGSMSYTFLKSMGIDTGESMVDMDSIGVCKTILKKAEEKKINFHLPVDHIAAVKAEPNITIRIVKKGEEIPDEMKGFDIGFETLEIYKKIIGDSELIFWNGPMGVFEVDTFSGGTYGIAEAVAGSDAFSIIGGGDSVSAINKSGLADKIDHISTGGGASLEFLSGKTLPGIKALTEA